MTAIEFIEWIAHTAPAKLVGKICIVEEEEWHNLSKTYKVESRVPELPHVIPFNIIPIVNIDNIPKATLFRLDETKDLPQLISQRDLEADFEMEHIRA